MFVTKCVRKWMCTVRVRYGYVLVYVYLSEHRCVWLLVCLYSYLGLTWLTGMFRRAAMSSTVSLPSEMMPTPLAIALAVMGWSPVTMMTLIPAERHLPTASGTAARGGSIMDIRPRKQRFSVGKFTSSVSKAKPLGNWSSGSIKWQKPVEQERQTGKPRVRGQFKGLMGVLIILTDHLRHTKVFLQFFSLYLLGSVAYSFTSSVGYLLVVQSKRYVCFFLCLRGSAAYIIWIPLTTENNSRWTVDCLCKVRLTINIVCSSTHNKKTHLKCLFTQLWQVKWKDWISLWWSVILVCSCYFISGHVLSEYWYFVSLVNLI